MPDKPCAGFSLPLASGRLVPSVRSGDGAHGFDWVDQFEFVEEGVQVESGLVRMSGAATAACLVALGVSAPGTFHAIGVADDDADGGTHRWSGIFVARIDDRAFEGGLQADFGVDVVGALAELVARNRCSRQFPTRPEPA